MVHQSHEVNKESKIAVTALFYKIGKPDRFLSKVKYTQKPPNSYFYKYTHTHHYHWLPKKTNRKLR